MCFPDLYTTFTASVTYQISIGICSEDEQIYKLAHITTESEMNKRGGRNEGVWDNGHEMAKRR